MNFPTIFRPEVCPLGVVSVSSSESRGGNRVIQKPDVVGRRIVPDVRVKDQSNLVVGPGRDQGFPQDLLLIGQIKDIDAQ